MSGFQFAHLEGFSRKGGFNHKTKEHVRNISEVAAEAERIPEYCPHVENPQPAIVRFGDSPSAVVKLAEVWAEQAKDALGRKLRIDGLCLAAGVISFPKERESDWPAYRDAAIEDLKKRYGDCLKSVVEHTDEENPHIHFYVVPEAGKRFDSVHDGYKAANDAKANGAKKGVQNAAYRTAMKEWQDSLYASFGLPFGLARLGPKRRRLTRNEWKIEQANIELLAKNIKPEAVDLSPEEFAEILNQQTPEHFSGVFGRGEPLYTAEQLRQAALDVGKTARDRQLQTNVNTFEIASRAVESAQANRTEELAALQNQVAELQSKIATKEAELQSTITAKDAEFKTLNEDYEKRGSSLYKAGHQLKQLQEELDAARFKGLEWRTKYQQEVVRANGLASALSTKEDELRELQQEQGIGYQKMP